MKKLVFLSAVFAAIFMAGCSSKAPTTTTNNDMYSKDMASIINGINSRVQNIYFDFDKFNIRADQQGALNSNAALFNSGDAMGLRVLVEWGSDEYNYALGVKRAKTAKDALVAQGVSESRIEIASNGESKPVCTERSKACDAQNRRDEFRVMQ